MRINSRSLVVLLAGLLAACSGSTTPTASPPPLPLPPTIAPGPSLTPSPASTPTPTETPAAEIDIRLATDGPVFEASDLDGGSYGFTLPAAYFTADGVQHLYVVGFGDLPGDQKVYHATSTNGTDWTVDPADPFADLGLSLSPPGPIPGTVVPADAGGWQMYFWGVPSPQVQGAQIYRATSPDPGGPWTADPDPVLPLGEPGEADDGGVDFPSVVATDDGYLMLYSASGGDHPRDARILLARSEDGITWEKAGRVIEPQDCGGEDAGSISNPRLFAADGGYLAVTLLESDVAVLRSVDGEHWTCADDGPVFAATEIEGSDRVHTMAAAQDGDDIKVLLEALLTDASGDVFSNLWLGEVTGL